MLDCQAQKRQPSYFKMISEELLSKEDHRGPRPIGFDTQTLHAGQSPDPTTGARATPIYQSAAFVFPDSDFAAGLFNIERAGHVYSRLSNPTNAVLEERMAALDHGVGAIVTSSGQAAMLSLIHI